MWAQNKTEKYICKYLQSDTIRITRDINILFGIFDIIQVANVLIKTSVRCVLALTALSLTLPSG